ncbi:MAG: HEAT repeat domain-containing protein [Chloracidobacterium sp.]
MAAVYALTANAYLAKHLLGDLLDGDSGKNITGVIIQTLNSVADVPRAARALLILYGLSPADMVSAIDLPKALTTVRTGLTTKNDRFCRSDLIRVLRHGIHHPELRQIVLDVLANDRSGWVRLEAAEALTQVSHLAEVQEALLEALAADPNRYVRIFAAYTLKTVVEVPKVQQAIMKTLSTDPHFDVRLEAAKSLTQVSGQSGPRQALMTAMRNDSHEQVRCYAAAALEPVAHLSEVAEELWTRLTTDRRSNVRYAIVNVLHKSPKFDELAPRLRDRFLVEPCLDVRTKIALALMPMLGRISFWLEPVSWSRAFRNRLLRCFSGENTNRSVDAITAERFQRLCLACGLPISLNAEALGKHGPRYHVAHPGALTMWRHGDRYCRTVDGDRPTW